jgi:drug/metabolite transporter (DMT)-like permease
MSTNRRRAVAALTAAGLLWGTTVPLSKLALGWLAPGWLTFVRFGLAAAILLAAAPRARVRAACTPSVLASGAIGYGGSVVVQNAGITRTSVSHAALLIGATPVLVAIIAALWHRTVARPVAWVGFAVSLAGVGPGRFYGGGRRDGHRRWPGAGVALSAALTVAQARRLQGRDPVALTAVQFPGRRSPCCRSGGRGGVPALPAYPGAVLAVASTWWWADAAAVHAVRLRTGPGVRRGGRGVPQPEPLVGAVAGVVSRRPGLLVQLAAWRVPFCWHRPEQPPAAGAAGTAARPRASCAGRHPRRNHARARSRIPQPGSCSPGSRSPDPAAPDPAALDLAAPILQPGSRSPGSCGSRWPCSPGASRSGIRWCRIPLPRNDLHGRPPHRPGPVAYRAAARACRWAVAAAQCRPGYGLRVAVHGGPGRQRVRH